MLLVPCSSIAVNPAAYVSKIDVISSLNVVTSSTPGVFRVGCKEVEAVRFAWELNSTQLSNIAHYASNQ
jgi:hypothetical protein